MDETVSGKIEKFFSQYEPMSFKAGQTLISSGEAPDYIYQLVSGKVSQYDQVPGGDKIILSTFKPPAFFPMSIAINKTPTPYLFEAETDAEIRQVMAEDAVEFLKSNPDVLLDLLSRVYRGTDYLLQKISTLEKEKLDYTQ